jgi:large subunit ribosomal protein L9
MTSEVILKKDIDGLGDEGDIKIVAAGYARNYLLPFGFAVVKNKTNLNELEKEKEEINDRKAEKIDTSKSLVEKVDNIEVTLKANASDTGKLFGSITQLDIYNAIKDEKGYELDKKQILLPKPIKMTGDYDIKIKFYGNLYANIKLKVNNLEEESKTEIE